MTIWLVVGGVITALTGALHSILGERLGLVPSEVPLKITSS